MKMGPTATMATTSKRKFLLRLIWLQNPGEGGRERVRLRGDVGTQVLVREFHSQTISDIVIHMMLLGDKIDFDGRKRNRGHHHWLSNFGSKCCC